MSTHCKDAQKAAIYAIRRMLKYAKKHTIYQRKTNKGINSKTPCTVKGNPYFCTYNFKDIKNGCF